MRTGLGLVAAAVGLEAFRTDVVGARSTPSSSSRCSSVRCARGVRRALLACLVAGTGITLLIVAAR
ncbi:hypothetical protein [Rhodococcus sp. NPDC127527]|uniref:hypothetical protein n=1 Tax=Rhodococcus sp. NPDC127527 TaxID=3345394 RepID=UPI00363A6AA3